MKYFLAFKGVEETDDNNVFTLINGDLIHAELDTNNNLKTLCHFTGRFADEKELKDTIIRLNPVFKKNEDDELVIAWKRLNEGVEEINYNSVIYNDTVDYLNYDNLTEEQVAAIEKLNKNITKETPALLIVNNKKLVASQTTPLSTSGMVSFFTDNKIIKSEK